MSRIQVALPLLIGLFSICSAAQPVPRDLGTDDVKSMVDDIDSHLKRLNRSRAMLQTGTDRGGELTIYRRGSDVVRIDAIIGGSNSDLQDVFYYSSANLVFVRSRKVTYPYSLISNGFDFRKPHVEAETSYYVHGGKLLPTGHVKIAPSVASRLLHEGELFMSAVRQGKQLVDIENLLK
jgi:hypothetical protein